MKLSIYRASFSSLAIVLCLLAVSVPGPVSGQSSDSQSSSSGRDIQQPQAYVREKAPTLVDPAGPTISLISSEAVFVTAAALNMCGYDEGLQSSAPVRKQVRDEIDKELAASESARASRDALCLYIAQHRMTGTELDVSQYISLAFYLSPPPELEITTDLTEMPPDATQVAEFVPLLKKFVEEVDLHGIWLTVHHTYDEAANQLHNPLTNMIVSTNLYLKMPASTYDGRRFIVVIEPMLSSSTVNARIYDTDYVVVVSPVDGRIRMDDVRHTYLHYVIDPLLFARANAIDRAQPLLKLIRDAPLDYRFRSDTVPLMVECLIKAIEARTMDTGIPDYMIPSNVDRSQLPRFQHEVQLVEQQQEAVRQAAIQHDMKQGFALTQYFYEQLIQFERQPASLKDTIGEMVYGMDVEQQESRIRHIEFDKQADAEVLGQSKPHKVTGLELAEVKLSDGDVAGARAMAQNVLAMQSSGSAQASDVARAHFIMARVELINRQPDQAIEDFQKTLAMSKDNRLLAWSHIYLGRILDLECDKRDQAVAEYKEALVVRDGQQDTRLAAERGIKSAYTVKGFSCSEDDDASNPPADKEPQTAPDQKTNQKPQ